MSRFVDFEKIRQLSARDVLESTGTYVSKKGVCFCPNPNCPDHNSKKAGAKIYLNKVHCFVEGRSYDVIQIERLALGLPEDQSGYIEAATSLAEKYCPDAIHYYEKRNEKGELISESPNITYYRSFSQRITNKLLMEIGLKGNPFKPNHIYFHANGADGYQSYTYKIDSLAAIAILIEKTEIKILDLQEEIKTEKKHLRYPFYYIGQELLTWMNQKEFITQTIGEELYQKRLEEYEFYLNHREDPKTLEFLKTQISISDEKIKMNEFLVYKKFIPLRNEFKRFEGFLERCKQYCPKDYKAMNAVNFRSVINQEEKNIPENSEKEDSPEEEYILE